MKPIKIIKEYNPDSKLFVKIKKDDIVEFIKVYTDNPEWENWVECSYMNQTCYIPKQYLYVKNNQYYLNRDYDSTELVVSPGMLFVLDFHLNGFAYGNIEGLSKKGWIPLSVLDQDDLYAKFNCIMVNIIKTH